MRGYEKDFVMSTVLNIFVDRKLKKLKPKSKPMKILHLFARIFLAKNMFNNIKKYKRRNKLRIKF